MAIAVAGAGVADGGVRATNGCALLTRAEVVAAIKEPLLSVQGGKASTGAVFCNWTGKDTRLFSKGISLTAASDNAVVRYKQYLALMKKKTPLAGVGAAAVTDGQIIVARSAKAMIQIGPLYANSGITLATIKALAKKALARA
ncbi:MAG: hypothetical protein WKF41_09095 [Gaiellaceae bacterium]